MSFVANSRGHELYVGFVDALRLLHRAGCMRAYLDGSYVTGAPHPGDYDVCWDESGVDRGKLDPLLLNYELERDRVKQKVAFGGEFFPSTAVFGDFGKPALEVFQQDKSTGRRKGIVAISLSAEQLFLRREYS